MKNDRFHGKNHYFFYFSILRSETFVESSTDVSLQEKKSIQVAS